MKTLGEDDVPVGYRVCGPLQFSRLLLIAAAMLAAGLGCGFLPTDFLSAEILRKGEPGGEIVVVGEDGNIHIVDPADGSSREITDDSTAPGDGGERLRTYGNPAWAPATGHLAFTELAATEDGLAKAAVHVVRAGEDEAEVVYDDPSQPPFYLYWSPVGQELTFLTSGQGDDLGLWLVGEEGEARQLDRGQPYYWSWAPDGSALISHVGGSAALNPRAELRLIDPQSGRITTLDLAPLRFQAPAYAPGGDRLLVAVEGSARDRGLVTLSALGDVQSTLVNSERPLAFAWSPSGRQVAYVEGRATGGLAIGELALLELARERDPALIQPDLPAVSAFFWSPSGNQLAAIVPELAPPGQDQQIGRSLQGEQLVMRLYLVQGATGEAEELATFRPTREFLSVLPFFDQYAQSATIWSPTGSHLVYTTEREADSDAVYIVEAVSGGEKAMVAEGSLAFWSFETSSD